MRLGELDKVSKMQESEQLKNDQVPEAIPDSIATPSVANSVTYNVPVNGDALE